MIKLSHILNDILQEDLNYDQLYNKSDPARKDRASKVRVTPLHLTTDHDDEVWNFKYKSNPSTTGKPHRGSIKFFKADADKTNDMKKVNCIVDCDCSDYRYKYAYANTKKNAGITGNDSKNKALNQPPIKTNPRQTEGLCKHLLALEKYIQTNVSNSSSLKEGFDNIKNTEIK